MNQANSLNSFQHSGWSRIFSSQCVGVFMFSSSVSFHGHIVVGMPQLFNIDALVYVIRGHGVA